MILERDIEQEKLFKILNGTVCVFVIVLIGYKVFILIAKECSPLAQDFCLVLYGIVGIAILFITIVIIRIRNISTLVIPLIRLVLVVLVLFLIVTVIIFIIIL